MVLDQTKVIYATFRLFSEKGINATKMDDIAQDLGCGLAELQAAYPDIQYLKQQVAHYCFQDLSNSIASLWQPSIILEEFIKSIVYYAFEDFEKRPDFYKFTLLSYHSEDLNPEFILVDFGQYVLGHYGFEQKIGMFLANSITGLIAEVMRSVIKGYLPGNATDYAHETEIACLTLLEAFSKK